jgi:(1->4)-alpha-D-glucan 1-alpha-D-glucosylmutase
VRARINVLCEIPDEWERAIWRWHHLNEPLRLGIEGTDVPDPNEEYLFYQTLLGTWPTSTLESMDYERYVQRIVDYLLKASKEAKVVTSWISPDHDHDRGLVEFVQAIAFSPTSPCLQAGLRLQACSIHYRKRCSR